ncbi:MAG TPA: aldose 1-epimerase [Ramlibacter sp.]|nr:aldose 1-epimerase [Ramlibacter sp.]
MKKSTQEGGLASAAQGLVHLSAGQLHLVLTPEVGGSIASFSRKWREAGVPREVHWLRPASAEGLVQRDPLAMASFPLLPFCNRIRNGRAEFEGREIQFPPNHPSVDSPHPLHGIGWQKPWQVLSAGRSEAVLGLEVEASAAWPWAFSAKQSFLLDDKGLEVTMTLTNEDTAAMPAGIGHHPYFPHEAGTRVRMPSTAMWEGDAEVMPTRLVESDAVRKLRQGVVLAELDLDNNFVGWDHWSRVDWPADGKGPARSLLMEAEAPLDYFVVYCPKGYDHFCAEPVSQCTDWLNLMAEHGPDPLGGTRLAAGETLTARFRLVPGWY